MKHEWRKKEKTVYIAKKKPELIQIPEYQFISIEGEGNPNNPYFSEYIGVLYSLAYTIKMSLKNEPELEGYYDFTVYPLEGIWDINEKAKKSFKGVIDKNDLVFKLMIRQPDFVNEAYFNKMMAFTKNKKPHKLLEQVKLEKITDGQCIQIMHIGSYDDEAASFQIMEDFAEKKNLLRETKSHREIYLSDFRKVALEKLKTVLRFSVKNKLS